MFGRSTQFDRALEKATSQLLLEPDWDSTLQICDYIRQCDVQAKYAVSAVRKRIGVDNPHVAMFAIQVLEAMMKNCGSVIHNEVATRDFMEFFKEQANKKSDPVRAKILELIQVWAHAFRNEPQYKIIQDTMTILKVEGQIFPSLRVADAMFSSEKAPEWKDGESCLRCRVQFGTFNRKHHCRACGNIFCAKCSSKSTIIPKFGIEKEVRVCDPCYEDLSKQGGAKKSPDEDQLPAEYLSSPLSQQPQTPVKKSEQELQEEEELQLAIALSQSEEEEKAKQRNRMKGGNYPTTSKAPESTQVKTVVPMIDTSDMDPELARYLNRNYWEQKQVEIQSPTTTQPSAPVVISEPKTTTVKVEEKYQNGETDDEQQFLNALRSSIEIFVNRMKSNSQRSRSIANDSSVQTLFMTINAMHPRLIKDITDQEDARAHIETLQDKLMQLKDAREALDVLRQEHQEKKRQEQEELERQRQIQMAQTLTLLRQKKQEYLEYQRQLAVQRMREQEHEMQMRIEQQKQLQHMRAMQYSGAPYQPQMYVPSQGFSPGTSPIHQAYLPQGMVSMTPGDPNAPQQYNQSLYPGQMVPPPGGYMPQPGPGMPAMGQPGPTMPQQVPGMPPQGMMPGGVPGMQPQMAYNMQGQQPLPQGQQQLPPGQQQVPQGQQQLPQGQQQLPQGQQQLHQGQQQQQLPQGQQQQPPLGQQQQYQQPQQFAQPQMQQQQPMPQQQQQFPQQQQQLPQQQQQLPQQQQQLPQQPQQPQQQQQPQQPGQTEATLISFD